MNSRATPRHPRDAITAFMARHRIPVIVTQTLRNHLKLQRAADLQTGTGPSRKAGLGELATQETITQLALAQPPQGAVLLFEDHEIARASLSSAAGHAARVDAGLPELPG